MTLYSVYSNQNLIHWYSKHRSFDLSFNGGMHKTSIFYLQ